MNSEPSTHQPTLDNVETDVVDYCNSLYSAKRDEYNKQRPVFEERMRPPKRNRGADALVDEACAEMRREVAER